MEIHELTDDAVVRVVARTLRESTSFAPVVCVALAEAITKALEGSGWLNE